MDNDTRTILENNKSIEVFYSSEMGSVNVIITKENDISLLALQMANYQVNDDSAEAAGFNRAEAEECLYVEAIEFISVNYGGKPNHEGSPLIQ